MLDTLPVTLSNKGIASANNPVKLMTAKGPAFHDKQ